MCLFTATTNASYVTVISMIAVRVRCARVDMKILNDLFKHPMKLKLLIDGVVIAVLVFTGWAYEGTVRGIS